MKKNLLLKVVAVALIAIAFISCKKEIQPTGIKLNQTTLALETGNTANLIATVEPAGAAAAATSAIVRTRTVLQGGRRSRALMPASP